ncbi:MAG: hypothetical protein IT463_12315 [Planctomycetes bacterium]|nr:hypothetical protein [Planctomycetota bacterium]
MNLLSPAALSLLAAVPVLLWLALRRARPVVLAAGTLLIWRRVAARAPAPAARRHRLDLLLWLALAALAVGALASARPVLPGAAPAPVVAVYVERLLPSGEDPQLPQVRSSAEREGGGAALEFFTAGGAEGMTALNPGTLAAELAQFEAASRHASARLLFLATPEPAAARLGRVLPRLPKPLPGCVFNIEAGRERLVVRSSAGPVTVSGAVPAGSSVRNGEAVLEFTPGAGDISVRDGLGREYILSRRELRVGLGPDWSGANHKALFAALQATGDGLPDLWLGAREGTPAVRVNAGEVADLSGAETSFDSRHPLFAELPLAGLDFVADNRLLPADSSVQPVVTASRRGEVLGALVTVSADGRVVRFAGDPFARAPVTAGALLLDNAIGVVMGVRPSRRPAYETNGPVLPSRRAALAVPFEPTGALELRAAPPAVTELAPLAAVLAALLALGAALASAGSVRNPG